MQLVGSDGADSPKIMDMLHMLVSLQDAVVVGSLYTVWAQVACKEQPYIHIQLCHLYPVQESCF